MSLREYAQDKIKYISALLLAEIMAGGFLWIIGIKQIFIWMLLIIWLSPFLCAFFIEYVQKKTYFTELEEVFLGLDRKSLLSEMISEADFLEGKKFCSILKRTDKYVNDMLQSYQCSAREYKEYVEMWIHEVKVPLTTMRLLCARKKELWSEQMEADLDRMEAYMEQALYYARSTSLEKDFFVKRLSLEELVSDTLKEYARELVRVKAAVEFRQLGLDVYGDPKWLSFILRQMLSNSVKYRGEDPLRLTFSGAREKEQICLKVEDNGIGIPDSDLERIFDKGFTGQNGRQVGRSTGIGLYLCKKLCRKMNLEIRAFPLEQGCCIAILFPVNSMIEEVNPAVPEIESIP